MEISIEDHKLPYETHSLYDVKFFGDKIRTLVTHTASFVNTWIAETQQKLLRNNHPAHHPLIVGLDIEWRPNMALTAGNDCLIFQLLYCPTGIPQSLYAFLSDTTYTFVGVGIENDAKKLMDDHGLRVGNAVDLRELWDKRAGEGVLGKGVEKPKRITLSRWDNAWLSAAQVQYACLDAFLSWKIGESLLAA
ncbi:Werner Syndrome exonuclease [Salix suchowensis]|nr:Werner Syndrome exonuclease [Salix suchowensis]